MLAGVAHAARRAGFGKYAIWLSFSFSPPWTGFFYFVNLDISASIWVFYVIVRLQRAIFNTLGVHSTQRIDFYSEDPFLAHQGLGAMIVFVLAGLWVARRHLRDVVVKACGGLREVDDSGELLSYRQAFFGLLGSLLAGADMTDAIRAPEPEPEPEQQPKKRKKRAGEKKDPKALMKAMKEAQNAQDAGSPRAAAGRRSRIAGASAAHSGAWRAACGVPRDAKCSAGQPALFGTVTSAPWCSSSFAASTWPSRAHVRRSERPL